jgi:hypothetical protein
MTAKPRTTKAIAQELAEALDMLLKVATDNRTRLPKGELYTEMALNLSRQALASAKAIGIEPPQ